MSVQTRKINFLLFSSIVSVAVGIVISLLVPKVLADGTAENLEFGLYRNYLFYLPYLCIFHVGFVNGTYIRISNSKNLSEDELKKQYVDAIYVFFILQIAFTCFFALVDFFLLKQFFKWIVITMFFYNIEALFVKLLNARLHVYALSIYELFNKFFILIFVLLMFFGAIAPSSKVLIISNVVMHAIVAIVLFFFFRKIVFSTFNFKNGIHQFLCNIKIGLPLLMSYFLVLAIVGSASIIIEYKYGVKSADYSNYQFVYSLMALITGLLSYFNGLILPLINKAKEEKVENYYHLFVCFIFAITGFLLLLLPIVSPVLKTFFQEYINSRSIFIVSVPTLGFQILYYSVFYSFYQLKYYQKRLMLINLFCTVSMFGTLSLVSLLTNNLILILLIYVGLLFCWFFVLSLGLSWKNKKNIVFELISALSLLLFAAVLWICSNMGLILFTTISISSGLLLIAPNVFFVFNEFKNVKK